MKLFYKDFGEIINKEIIDELLKIIMKKIEKLQEDLKFFFI